MLYSPRLFSIVLALGALVSASPFMLGQSIRLSVDLTDAPRNIYHARLNIPAKAGDMTLVFPKWIPGNHRPSGPIAALTGIHMEAAGKPLAWQRDEVDMYAFHVTVPEASAFDRRISGRDHRERQRRRRRSRGFEQYA